MELNPLSGLVIGWLGGLVISLILMLVFKDSR